MENRSKNRVEGDEDSIPSSSVRSKRSDTSKRHATKTKPKQAATQPGAVPHTSTRRHHHNQDDGDALPMAPPPRREDSAKIKSVGAISARTLDNLDLVRNGGAVYAVPIDEEAYRQELLREAAKRLDSGDDFQGGGSMHTHTKPILVHAEKTASKTVEEEESERKQLRCKMFVYVAIGVVILVALVIGLAVGLGGGGDEKVTTFPEFCKLVKGFYDIHEKRMVCSCDGSLNTVNCQGDYDHWYSGVVMTFQEETGAYSGVECFCDTLECPETSFACFTVVSEDQCEITDGFLSSEELCDGKCSYCEDDEYYSVSLASCVDETEDCMKSFIPKPDFLLESFSVNLPPTPALTQPSSFAEFCNSTSSVYEAMGFACECDEDYEDVQNNQGENMQMVFCMDPDDRAVFWLFEENSIDGTECECFLHCEGPQLCTLVSHDYTSGYATCRLSDFADESGENDICGPAECKVCVEVEGESFFRVDTFSCDGSERCHATELLF
jgi:hypothetical protein